MSSKQIKKKDSPNIWLMFIALSFIGALIWYFQLREKKSGPLTTEMQALAGLNTQDYAALMTATERFKVGKQSEEDWQLVSKYIVPGSPMGQILALSALGKLRKEADQDRAFLLLSDHAKTVPGDEPVNESCASAVKAIATAGHMYTTDAGAKNVEKWGNRVRDPRLKEIAREAVEHYNMFMKKEAEKKK